MFSYIITGLYIIFMLPISIHMISIIRLNKRTAFTEDEKTNRTKAIQQKVKKVIILTLLFIALAFLTYFIHYLIAGS